MKKDGRERPSFTRGPWGAALRFATSVQVTEEEEDQDDRQRDADQPEKTTLHHGETSSSSAEQRASPRPVPCSSLTWPSFAPRRCRPPVGGLNPAHDRPEDPPHRP